MENRRGTALHITERPEQFFSIFLFLLSIFLFSDGCGAPGEPVPPSPPVPVAIRDLAARQAGDGVQISFTLPTHSISGEKLAAPPAVEILRGTVKSDGSADTRSFRVVYTIPGALVDSYRGDGHVRFTDPIAPEETKSHPGAEVTYIVRTRASQKRASADSNVVALRLFPVPASIVTVESLVTEYAVELTWPVPNGTGAGDPVSITGYRIYRAEVHPSAPAPPPLDPTPSNPESHASVLASSETNSY